MAHNIENKNGKSSIVWTGETPWHNLGQKLTSPFTAQQALAEGGLDFTVEKVGLQTVDGMPLADKFGLRRTDTKKVLGVVTGFYQPLQNREAFGFFDELFGKGKARYEVAGVLGEGEKVWLLAKMTGDMKIVGDDTLGKYLLLTNGHDTNEPVRAKFTPIRVVCQNTLNAALRGTESEIRVQHIGKVAAKLEIAANLLKSAGIYFDEISAPAQRTVSRIEELHETGRGHDLKGVRGTLWAAYNAVTELVDHERATESVAPMLGGRGLELKQRAFTVAQDMILAGN